MAELKLTASALLDLDTNALFEKHTIEEIRKVEKSTRFQIEKKKEDLRQMVGERYRDLIEAADTIADMGRCAENIVSAVQGMQQYCTDLQQSQLMRSTGGNQTKQQNRKSVPSGFYGIASQIKLLVDMPEKIWSAIEDGKLLRATQLFLLSRHIVSSLQLDANTQKSAQLLSWFPILSRQWAAISHFKTSILQSCRSVLKDVKMSEQAIAEALCSILLLDDSSPRQVFTEFLLARKSAVQQFFHPYQPGIGIKSQVCGVIQLICTTVQHIYAVFYNSPDDTAAHCNLLLKIVEEVTDNSNKGHKKVLSKEMSSSSFAKYLPSSITEFHPVLNTLASPISAEYLQKSCQEWVDTCIQDINSGVGKLFTYLTTIKGLTGVRDALWELLGQFHDKDVKLSESKAEENFEVKWKTICDCVLNRNLSPWDEFIRPLFLTRAQTIIQNMLDNTTDSTQKLIGQALDDIAFLNSECNVARYIWTESVSDTPPASVWSTPLVNRSPSDGGGLYMKSRAFTPRTQSLCNTMEKKLKSLLDDLAYYALVESNQNKDVSQVAPFDKFADRDNLLIFLQTACYKCVDRLLEYINQQLAEAEKLLTESQDDGDANKKQILLNRALLLGRLCAALCDLTPNLQQCMLGLQAKEVKAEQSRGYSRRFGSLRSHGKSKGNPEPTEWDKIKELLNANCHKAYSVWMTCKRVELVGNFQSSLTDITGNTALQMATNWEQISIEEETEDGNKVTSTIRLPVQASWYVQSVLYSLCEEFNRVGGHALPKSVIQEMITSISDDMLSAYERILDNTSKDDKPLPLTQSRALQLYFDVKYMSSLMSGRKDTEQESTEHARRIQKLTETLENNIDPFDLDVFIPHLNTNLNRHSIRTSVLLGALSTPERPIYSHRPIPTGHQEQHNVLPLTPAQGRFSLLPLSTTHSGYGDGQSLLSKQLQLTTPSLESITRSSTKTDETIDSNTASSLYSKLGSFGSFRSNWLS